MQNPTGHYAAATGIPWQLFAIIDLWRELVDEAIEADDRDLMKAAWAGLREACKAVDRLAPPPSNGH